MNPVTQRPESLSEVAERADSIEGWGLALGDLLDEIGFRRGRGLSVADCVQVEPRLLRQKFAQGEVADAFAAALAEHIVAEHPTELAPAWTRGRGRFLAAPWFADESSKLREYLLASTPPAFREHGVFIDVISLSRA